MVARASKHPYNQEFNMNSRHFSNFIGIDVSKDKIDVFCSEGNRHFVVKNDTQSISQIMKKFDISNSYVVLENTGGYERICSKVLIGLKFTLHRTNNRKARKFMDSLEGEAKTDSHDARKLSIYGEERHEKLKIYEPRSEESEELRQLALYLDELKKSRAAEKNRLRSPGCDKAKTFIQKIIEEQSKVIDEVQKEIERLTESDKEFQRKRELLREFNGIGPVSATNLLLFMPELGSLTRRESAALAAVAPIAKDSGKKRGYRKTGQGRPILKRTLFMIALGQCQKNSSGEISDYYKSLLKNGKKKMVAITACMRKIIVKLNAILRDGKIIQKTC
jgi:transposase